MTTIFLTLYFDTITETAVQKIIEKLADIDLTTSGENRHRPHITLSAYDVEDVEASIETLAKFTSQIKTFPLRLHYLGIFPEKGVLFLAPMPTTQLFDTQRALQKHFRYPVKYPDHLTADNWTPHCTLATGLNAQQLAQAVKLCTEDWQAIIGKACGIGLLIAQTTEDLYQVAFTES